MRAVLDTNVVVSACWKQDGLEARTVNLASEGAFTPCVSAEIVAEYRDVLARKKLGPVADRTARMLAALERNWIVIATPVRMSLACDEDDNRFLECAVAAAADYLVTGNLRHYPERCGSTRIVNARRFLAECFGECESVLPPKASLF